MSSARHCDREVYGELLLPRVRFQLVDFQRRVRWLREGRWGKRQDGRRGGWRERMISGEEEGGLCGRRVDLMHRLLLRVRVEGVLVVDPEFPLRARARVSLLLRL